MVLKQNGRRQEKLVAAVFSAYVQGDVKPITGGLLNSTAPFTPFHVGVRFGTLHICNADPYLVEC